MLDNNKVDVNLPEKLTEPMNKLVDAVSNAVGSLFDPDKIKARAEARGAALITRTKAQIHAMELQERAQERVRAKEERRQQNIESITAKALLALPEKVDEKQPEEDWIHQFFGHAEDIGNDEMQTVWAKLLAGEVAKPGSFSLLTLATLKNLTQDEADLFTKYCRLLWVSRGVFLPIVTLYHGDMGTAVDEEFRKVVDVNHSECQRLQDHGLINFDGIRLPGVDTSEIIYYYGIEYYLKPKMGFEVGQTLTMAGQQLAPISGSKPDMLYMMYVLKFYNHLFDHPFSDEEFNKCRESLSKQPS